MKLQMLGTGSAFAKAYYNNNAILESDGRKLMIDCGTTAPRALFELGIGFDTIDAILISHIHADHIGGLEEFAFQCKFKFKRRPVLYIADNLVEPLWEHSLRGGLEQEGFRSIDEYFDVQPLKPGTQAQLLPGIQVELLHTSHIPGKISYSFLINDYIFYTADMVFNRELLEQLVDERGVSVIFHDCQLHSPGIVHADLAKLLTLPEKLQKMIYLMHYDDNQPAFIGRSGSMEFIEQHCIYEITVNSVVLADEIR